MVNHISAQAQNQIVQVARQRRYNVVNRRLVFHASIAAGRVGGRQR